MLMQTMYEGTKKYEHVYICVGINSMDILSSMHAACWILGDLCFVLLGKVLGVCCIVKAKQDMMCYLPDRVWFLDQIETFL